MVPGATTQAVRDLASQRGVSERTAWRWVATMRASGELSLLGPRQCEYCGRELPTKATARRQYCHVTCRVYAHRTKQTRRAFRDVLNGLRLRLWRLRLCLLLLRLRLTNLLLRRVLRRRPDGMLRHRNQTPTVLLRPRRRLRERRSRLK